jgi:hypothetical protein
MTFDRNRLPDPQGYFESVGLVLSRGGQWRTTRCEFHGGSDSMRVNLQSGSWVCMAGCGARGGDVLAYEMAHSGTSFVDAAKALGAWIEDGKPPTHTQRPAPFPARDALQVLDSEANFVAICAGSLATGVVLSDNDRARLLQAANRISLIARLGK